MQEFANRFEGITGSEIRKIFALLADSEIISFAGGNPSPAAFPSEELAEISAELLRTQGGSVLQYGGTPGVGALIGYLKEMNAHIMKETDDVIILTGSSQGIEAFARCFINEGDNMLVESPSFLGALQTFRLNGAKLHSVTLNEDGVDIAELEEKLKTLRPKFFYVIPTFQNPSGITTSAEKRRQIYSLCEKYGAMILEDDPYAELRYEGEPIDSIKALDEAGIVCKLSSFSKTISPGLRVGYAIAHKDVIAKINLLKQGLDVHTSNLSQAMVLEFLRRGLYKKHVERLRSLYRTHRDTMLDVLEKNAPEQLKYTRPMGGLFLWAYLPEGMDSDELFKKAVEQKVAFVPGRTFFAENPPKNAFRLNFSMPTLPDIELGITKLCSIIKEYM